MPTLGIIGGIGPESTAEYYRLLIAEYRRRNPDGSVAQTLLSVLAKAGADFALLASNTPPIVFNNRAERLLAAPQ